MRTDYYLPPHRLIPVKRIFLSPPYDISVTDGDIPGGKTGGGNLVPEIHHIPL